MVPAVVLFLWTASRCCHRISAVCRTLARVCSGQRSSRCRPRMPRRALAPPRQQHLSRHSPDHPDRWLPCRTIRHAPLGVRSWHPMPGDLRDSLVVPHTRHDPPAIAGAAAPPQEARDCQSRQCAHAGHWRSGPRCHPPLGLAPQAAAAPQVRGRCYHSQKGASPQFRRHLAALMSPRWSRGEGALAHLEAATSSTSFGTYPTAECQYALTAGPSTHTELCI